MGDTLPPGGLVCFLIDRNSRLHQATGRIESRSEGSQKINAERYPLISELAGLYLRCRH